MKTAERAARRRMTPGQRRQQIISRAAGLFDEGGYSSTTMDDIAREVGVAKPTLYHYFPSKDDILHAIHEEFIDLLISRHEGRAGTGLRPEQLLLEVMADILELMETHRGHVRVFFEHHRELPAEARGPIKVKRDAYEKIVEDLIGEGIGDGRAAPDRPSPRHARHVRHVQLGLPVVPPGGSTPLPRDRLPVLELPGLRTRNRPAAEAWHYRPGRPRSA